MIKVIDYGNTLKRSKSYYSVTCNHCGAKLVFEYNDIWFDQPMEGIGRVECPVCRTKVFMNFDMIGLPYVCKPYQTTKDEYEHAYKDTSKRGIEQLMAEKKKEDKEEHRESFSFGKTSIDDESKDAVKLRHPFGNENI